MKRIISVGAIFVNVTTVLRASGRVVHSTKTFVVSAARSLFPSRVPKRSNLKDRRIIADMFWGQASCLSKVS